MNVTQMLDRQKQFNGLPNPIKPYLMSARTYQMCAVDISTWTPYRNCTNQTLDSSLTPGNASILYSDYTQLEAWTGPTTPSITSATLVDCNSINVSMTSFDSENGVKYELKRYGSETRDKIRFCSSCIAKFCVEEEVRRSKRTL